MASTARTEPEASFFFPIRVDTAKPVRVLGVKVQNASEQLELRSWSIGRGLRNHIAENGEPPVCDVIIYPVGVGMFSVMVFEEEEAFDSSAHGEEWLVLEFAVRCEESQEACIFLESTEDYDPDEGIFWSSDRTINRQCVRVQVLDEHDPLLRRGDVNEDHNLSLSDAILVLQHLFHGYRTFYCFDAADFDDDGRIGISDPISLLSALFLGDNAAMLFSAPCRPDFVPDDLPSCQGSSC